MMGVDAFRNAALAGRKAAAATGIRTTIVTLVVEQYSGAVGAYGTTLSSTTSTVLTPAPKVEKVGDGAPSFFGGGWESVDGADIRSDLYKIGPITQKCTNGGYLPSELAPSGGENKRTYYLLSGDDFPGGGVKCRLFAMDASKPHQINLVVARTAQ